MSQRGYSAWKPVSLVALLALGLTFILDRTGDSAPSGLPHSFDAADQSTDTEAASANRLETHGSVPATTLEHGDHAVDRVAVTPFPGAPYACTDDCSKEAIYYDPLVAADAEEAAWMARNGFPDAAELEWARNSDADDIDRRAQAEASARLRMLALWRRAMTSDDPTTIWTLAMQLEALGQQSRLYYYFYLEFDMYMRAFDLAKSVQTPMPRAAYLQDAVIAARTAVALGDTKAVSMYRRIPHDYATPDFWASIDRTVVNALHLGRLFPQDRLPSIETIDVRPNMAADRRVRENRERMMARSREQQAPQGP